MQKNIYCVDSEHAEFEVAAGWFGGGAKKAADAVTKAGRGAANAAGRAYSTVRNQREAAAAETAAKKERKQDFQKALEYANEQLDGADGALDSAIEIMNKRQKECYSMIEGAISKRLNDQKQTKATLRSELYMNPKIQNSMLNEEKLIDWVKRQNFFGKEQ